MEIERADEICGGGTGIEIEMGREFDDDERYDDKSEYDSDEEEY